MCFSPIYRKNLLVFNFLVTKVFGMFISSSYLTAFKLSAFKRVYCCSLTTANYLFFDGCFFFLPKCSKLAKLASKQQLLSKRTSLAHSTAPSESKLFKSVLTLLQFETLTKTRIWPISNRAIIKLPRIQWYSINYIKYT